MDVVLNNIHHYALNNIHKNIDKNRNNYSTGRIMPILIFFTPKLKRSNEPSKATIINFRWCQVAVDVIEPAAFTSIVAIDWPHFGRFVASLRNGKRCWQKIVFEKFLHNDAFLFSHILF